MLAAALTACWDCAALTPGAATVELNQRTGDRAQVTAFTCPLDPTLRCR